MYIRQYTIFSTLHPALLFCYALGAPLLAMCGNHPVLLTMQFACAVCVHWFYLGGRNTLEGMKVTGICMLVVTGFNMLTNAIGITVLFRLGSRLVTLESLCYGLTNGLMLGTVILWFRCFTALISNDKFLYLFGRRFQTVALLLSMILKLFPETRYKIRCIQLAQGTADDLQKSPVRIRLHRSMRQISSLLEWSMEDGIETADAMKARGYGIGQRSSYQRYSFTGSDCMAGALMAFFYMMSIGTVLWQGKCFAYYPVIRWDIPRPAFLAVGLAALLIFLLLPLWMELRTKGGRK